MPKFIGREQVQHLVDAEDAIVAEVLPRPEYEWAHLAGAIHLPLKGWDVDHVTERVDRDRPVIVYCNNTECDQSPRAAWRLETLGYDAYDYVAGKQDWLSYGLPHEGEAVLAGEHVTTDVPTCDWRAHLGEVRDRLEGATTGSVVVVNDDLVVLGVVPPDVVQGGGDASVTDVMAEGPTTVRPGEMLHGLLHRMQHAEVEAVLVTRSDGTLVGLFERAVGEQALAEQTA